jgi:hypothetical protein
VGDSSGGGCLGQYNEFTKLRSSNGIPSAVMDENQQKEQFSVAYLHAVATVCGLGLSDPRVDDDSIDVTVGRTGGSGTIRSPRLDIQLKCSERELLKEDGVHIQLKRKNYDDLRAVNPLVPTILVVLLVPTSVFDWLLHVPETSLTLYRNAWWVSLRGAPEKSTVEKPSIVLPRHQIISPESLTAIIDRIGQGEFP